MHISTLLFLKTSLILNDIVGMLSQWQNLLYDQRAPDGHWLGNMVKLLQPYRLKHREMTGHLDLKSELGWAVHIIFIAKNHSGGSDFVICEFLILWLSDGIYLLIFINRQLYSSKTPCDSAFSHYFRLHTFLWTDFLSLWCHTPFLLWWYSSSCLWFFGIFCLSLSGRH